MTNQDRLKAVFKNFQTLTVVGANWGDEGKGKVIDLIMGQYDIVSRFSGGANAGHTVYTPEGKKIVSHLIPCGLAQGKPCVLARGEFFSLELFLKELNETRSLLGQTAAVYIDQQAPLWTPYHSLLELYIESKREGQRLGTTNKGIGPLEGIYKLRLSPVVGYLFNKEMLVKSINWLYAVFKPCFDSPEFVALEQTVPTTEAVVDDLLALAGQLDGQVTDTVYFLNHSLKDGKRILFEGAQATGLDAWWGTYPFVSSGNSVAAGAPLGTGLPVSVFTGGILVAKTLPTRVGNGPMPSEMWERQAAMDFAKTNGDLFAQGPERDKFLEDSLKKINSGAATNAERAQYFQVLGDERGATTGRGRSLGFLDIPWLQYAIAINGPKFLALTRFDMLSKIKSIPVVVGYKFKGEILPPGKLPPPWELKDIEPVFEEWEAWPEDIMGQNEFGDLPKAAKQFIERLEKHLDVPILLVGTGPGREAMVVRA